MSKQPFMPLFFGDLLASTADWDGEDRALYTMLLGYQWTLGRLPANPAKIARMCQYDAARFAEIWDRIQGKFDATEDGLKNTRLEQHRLRSIELSQVNSARAKVAANARWHDASSNPPSNASSNARAMPPSHPIPSYSDQDKPKEQQPHASRSVNVRGTRLPQPFTLSPDMLRWLAGKCPHVDAPKATEEFCDYWKAIPGQRGRKTDWEATWRNRMREVEGRSDIKSNGHGKATGAAAEAWERLLASGGAARTNAEQVALDAIGGWYRVRTRTPQDEAKLKSEFCHAYHG